MIAKRKKKIASEKILLSAETDWLRARRALNFGKKNSAKMAAGKIIIKDGKLKVAGFGFMGALTKGLKTLVCLSLILSLVVLQTIFVAGYEGHVINVTAKICNYSEMRAIGYWKNHPEIYKHLLPQDLGRNSIDTVSEANYILRFSGNTSMRNKLEAQLLAMKFNIFYYQVGGYFVESEGKTISEIAADADTLLLNANAKKSKLEKMKNLLDNLNNLRQIRSCATGIVINEFLPNPVGNDNAPKPKGEWVELYNLGDAEVDLKGWALYDSRDNHELLITALNTDTGDTMIKPKGFLTVYRNGDADFNLNNRWGDAVRLYDNTINKGVLIDIYAYTVNAPEGKSFARIPDGSANWVDPLPTPGEPNSNKGENLLFGPVALEDGEDAEVLNMEMEIETQNPEVAPAEDTIKDTTEDTTEDPILPSSPTPALSPAPADSAPSPLIEPTPDSSPAVAGGATTAEPSPAPTPAPDDSVAETITDNSSQPTDSPPQTVIPAEEAPNAILEQIIIGDETLAAPIAEENIESQIISEGDDLALPETPAENSSVSIETGENTNMNETTNNSVLTAPASIPEEAAIPLPEQTPAPSLESVSAPLVDAPAIIPNSESALPE